MRALEMRALAGEASRALARLDAERLEELGICCAALRRDLEGQDRSTRLAIIRQARDAWHEMEVFARVLEATGANVAVVSRLRDSAEYVDGYPARAGRGSGGCGTPEGIDGDH